MSSNSVFNRTCELNKSDFRFVNGSYDYRPNWTPLSPGNHYLFAVYNILTACFLFIVGCIEHGVHGTANKKAPLWHS